MNYIDTQHKLNKAEVYKYRQDKALYAVVARPYLTGGFR